MKNFYMFFVLLIVASTTLLSQTTKLTGTIIGTEGSWGDNPETTIDAVFDGDLSSYCDPLGNGSWAGLDLGNDSLSVVSMFRFAPRSTHPSRMVGALIQGSHDIEFSTPVTLGTIITEPPIDTYTELAITNSTAYRYVRCMTPNSAFNAAEIEFYKIEKTDPVPVTDITVTSMGNVDSIWIEESLQMLAEVIPVYADKDSVIWSVDNDEVAIIDAVTGVLTGKSAGKVIITATAKDGSGITGADTIVITNTILLAHSIKLTGDIIGTEGSWGDNPETTVDAVFDENLSSYCDLLGNGSWAGLDLGDDSLSVVTMFRFAPRSTHPDRMVGALIQGSHDTNFTNPVTLGTIDSEPSVDAYSVMVLDNLSAFRYIRCISPNTSFNAAEIEFYKFDKSNPIPVTGINVTSEGDIDAILIGNTLQMNAEVVPSYAYDNSVTWSVNNDAIASVNTTTGLLTGKSAGVVVVTATASDGSGVTGADTITIKSELSDNAYLNSLSVDVGELSPAFDSTIFKYTLSVSASTSTVNITAIPSSGSADVSGDGAIDVSSGGKEVSVVVTAENNDTTKTYTISISKETTGINNSQITEAKIYPNPVQRDLYVKVSLNDQICIYNSLGQMLKNVVADSDHVVINVENLKPGIYMLLVNKNTEQAKSYRFIKKN